MNREFRRVSFPLFLIVALSPGFSAFAQSAPSAPAQTSPLADGGGRKLQEFVNQQGSNAPFDPQVTQMLGLTKPGEVLQLKQIGVRDDQDDIHAVNLLKSAGFLFVKISKNVSEVYQTDASLNLRTALVKKGNAFFSTVPSADAAATFRDELEFWAAVLDWKPEKK